MPVQAAMRPNAPILLYHHISNRRGRYFVSPARLEQELTYLAANHYQTVTIAAYVDAMVSNTALPDKAVVLTFDDGYRDNYFYAFPLLKKYGFIGTFFIITGVVGDPAYMTWAEIAEMHNAGMDFEAHTVDHPFLTHLSSKRAFWEMYRSRINLSIHLGQPVNVLAYPYSDHNAEVEMLARQAGFEGAVVVGLARGDNPNNPYTIPRIQVRGNAR